jgi:hypothetical protein
VSCLARCGDAAALRRWVTWSLMVSDSVQPSVDQRNYCRSIKVFTPWALAYTSADTQVDHECAARVQDNTRRCISRMTLFGEP